MMDTKNKAVPKMEPSALNQKFVIQGLGGKRKLKGNIRVNGAKNAALKAFAATILFKDEVKLVRVPEIEDIARIITLLTELGISVEKNGSVITCNTSSFSGESLCSDTAKQLRASVVLTGPVLARRGVVSFPLPGGCVIGARPIDLFIDGFKKMGATIAKKKDTYIIRGPKGGLRGAEIFFKVQSVTCTETLMMAAVLARGKTVLKNAALEPEIEHLANFLNVCGAKISGAGTPTIEIEGGQLLSGSGQIYTTPPDRIEAGTFLILGALCGQELTVRDCEPKHLEAVTELLKESGVKIRTTANTIVVHGKGVRTGSLKSVDVKTHEYPGFPTDLQALMAVYLTQTKGEATIFETIFENRLAYVEALVHMGADITAMDTHRILIRGAKKMQGRTLKSPDLRAGLAYVIAAVVAKGESVIHNVYNIDRGYERVEERLQKIGVDIERK